ncbi:MAG: hypothetical protein WCX61_02165 [Candidatus Peribacteraceae bacterium]|jgi:hypothetical protein
MPSTPETPLVHASPAIPPEVQLAKTASETPLAVNPFDEHFDEEEDVVQPPWAAMSNPYLDGMRGTAARIQEACANQSPQEVAEEESSADLGTPSPPPQNADEGTKTI